MTLPPYLLSTAFGPGHVERVSIGLNTFIFNKLEKAA